MTFNKESEFEKNKKDPKKNEEELKKELLKSLALTDDVDILINIMLITLCNECYFGYIFVHIHFIMHRMCNSCAFRHNS